MPPRKQPDMTIRDIEVEELKRQVRQLQETIEAHQNQLEQQRNNSNHDSGDSDSSSSSSYQVQRPRYQRHFNDFKVDIPEFEGRLQPDEFLDWLRTVERVFDLKDIPDEQKVKIVAIKLKKHASIWWENLNTKRVRTGKSKIKTWEKMKKKLTSKFLPYHYKQDNYM